MREPLKWYDANAIDNSPFLKALAAEGSNRQLDEQILA